MSGSQANLSRGRIASAERAATLDLELHRLDGLLSKGEAVDMVAYATIVNALNRMLHNIGLNSRTPEAPKSLAERAKATGGGHGAHA